MSSRMIVSCVTVIALAQFGGHQTPPLAAQATASPSIPAVEIVQTDVPSDLRLIRAVRGMIPPLMEAKGTPGLNLAVARRGRIIWEAGFGYADLQSRVPMRPETVFHSGSMGKTYTATAIMRLVEAGELALHDPVSRYLPFAVDNPFGRRPVTIHDFLTHQSGLSGGDAALSTLARPRALREALAEAYAGDHQRSYLRTRVPLWNSPVGERWQYSNLGIATLGLIVEETNSEGLSFSEYVQTHIVEPLGMKLAQLPEAQDEEHIRPDIWAQMSRGYARFGAALVPTPKIYFEGFPAGGLVATPGDHLRLLLATMNGGAFQGRRLLDPKLTELMLTPVRPTDLGAGTMLGELHQGLVWFLRWDDSRVTEFNHAGAHMYGWRNRAAAYPELDLAVVIAVNTWGVPNSGGDPDLVLDFISDWVRTERSDVAGPEDPDWAWKTSYVIGLLMVEITQGSIGASADLGEEAPQRMAKAALVMPSARNAESGWDQGGFVAGVNALRQVEMTEAAIRAFLASDELPVTHEEIRTIYRQLGGVIGTNYDEAFPYFVIPRATPR